MKLTVEREVLLDALTTVAPRAKLNTDNRSLKHLLLNASGDKLMLSGNDLIACCSSNIVACVDTPGDLAVPAKELHALVTRLPKGSQLSLMQDRSLLEIKCGRAKYDLPTLPAADMPAPLEVQTNHPVELTGDDIVTLFQRPESCVSDDQSRIVLNGIFLHASEHRLAACSADGHSLLRFRTERKVNGIDDIIVPRTILPELVKIGAEGARLSWTKRLLSIVTDVDTLTTRLIEGTFPDYPNFIPPYSPGSIDLDRQDLIAAFDCLSIIEGTPHVEMRWEDDPSTVTVTRGPQGIEVLDCVSEGLTAGFILLNPREAPVVLGSLKGEMIRLSNFGGKSKGNNGAVRIMDRSDPDVIALTSPGSYGKPTNGAAQ